MFPAQFNLKYLNGTNGFSVRGTDLSPQPAQQLGASVASVGDFNGDGLSDVVISAPDSLCEDYYDDDSPTECKGQVYMIFGSKDNFSPTFNLKNLNGKNGFAINGANFGDYIGGRGDSSLCYYPFSSAEGSISGAGDFNGDGLSDIIIGASNALDGIGRSYIVFGSRDVFSAQFNLAHLNGTNGFSVTGTNEYYSIGCSVSNVNDFNGDGLSDIIIGAPSDLHSKGRSYVIFGSKEGFNATFDLLNLDGKNGFAINGINGGACGDQSGSAVSSAGDFNGDGLSDVVISAPGALRSSECSGDGKGQSYIIFGSKEGFNATFDLLNLDGKNGFAINGIKHGDQIGYAVSGIGDFNGDGCADIIIGAPRSLPGGVGIGQTYVVFGSKEKFAKVFHLINLNGNNGFNMDIVREYPSQSGFAKCSKSVGSLGDINGDGYNDIIVSASQDFCSTDDFFIDDDVPSDECYMSQAYVILGSKEGFSINFPLNNVNGKNGFVVNNHKASELGIFAVAGAGDINGDGLGDIIIGSKDDLNKAGQSFVLLSDFIVPSSSPSPSPSSSPIQTPSSSAHPSSYPNPQDGSPTHLDEIIGGTVGGVVAIGAVIGLIWYGKTHGWCAGESNIDAYHEI